VPGIARTTLPPQFLATDATVMPAVIETASM
jgi:hypothetical protein